MSLAVENAKLTTAFLCPIHESSKYTCDRPAVHLVNGTAICNEHAKSLELSVHDLKIDAGKEFDALVKQGLENDSQRHYNDFMAGV